jgi:hypothetical protein
MELALDRLPVPATTTATAAAHCTDGELLTRIAERDAEAFEELYARYSRAVLGLALRRLRDRGRAEDAVQETFTSVWRAARSYKPETRPTSRRRGRAPRSRPSRRGSPSACTAA